MVRVADLPDLGAVIDATRLVGDTSGSGTHTATALANYIRAQRYGAVGDGVHDDTAALQAAVTAAAAAAPGGFLFLPPGIYKLSAPLTATLPVGASLTIAGSGSELTQLVWASGNGLTVNMPDLTNAVHIRDMTFATGANGTGTGLALNFTKTPISFPNSPQSDVSDCTFRGSDGQVVTHYWGTCIACSDITQIAFDNVLMVGSGTDGPYSTHGVGVSLTATLAAPGVVYNFDGCTFNNMGSGIVYGEWIQGVQIVNSNFTGCGIGIDVPNLTGETELAVSNSQFNCVTGISSLIALDSVMIGNSLFIIPQSGAAISAPGVAQLTITGNTFAKSASGNTTGQGIVISSGAALGGAITGNSFLNIAQTGVLLGSGTGAINVSGNTFVGCATPFSDAGTGNQIVNNLGIPPVLIAPTPGASPWSYSTGSRPENLSLCATTQITMVEGPGSVFLLGGGAAANIPVSVSLPPNFTASVLYTGTLTVRGMRL